MHDPELVRGFESIGDLARDRQRIRERDGAAGNQHREIVPLDQFHHERPKSRLRRPGNVLDAVDLGDVRMIQRRQRLRFTGEPREAVGVRLKQLGQHLEGHVAIQPRVARPVNLAHPALAEGGDDFERSDPGSRLEGHGGAILPYLGP
jgi:hypothetical protein